MDDAFADFFEDALERDGGLAIKRLGFVFVPFAQSDGVDDDETGLASGGQLLVDVLSGFCFWRGQVGFELFVRLF